MQLNKKSFTLIKKLQNLDIFQILSKVYHYIARKYTILMTFPFNVFTEISNTTLCKNVGVYECEKA